MSTILFPSPIFGPVRSRRLGISLGINLLPADGKICSFDCIYCECGRNAGHHAREHMPTRALVAEMLESALNDMTKQGELPDAITFAGNGEPTGHPDFAEIMSDTIVLRNRYAPNCKVTVLTNATHLDRPSVIVGLEQADLVLMKLDTVNRDYIELVDRPNARYDVESMIKRMSAFKGHCGIQTMFLRGQFQGQTVDNTSENYVAPWLEALRRIKPELVTIYTIDRETPEKGLRKADPEVLNTIAERVRSLGFRTTVSY